MTAAPPIDQWPLVISADDDTVRCRICWQILLEVSRSDSWFPLAQLVDQVTRHADFLCKPPPARQAPFDGPGVHVFRLTAEPRQRQLSRELADIALRAEKRDSADLLSPEARAFAQRLMGVRGSGQT